MIFYSPQTFDEHKMSLKQPQLHQNLILVTEKCLKRKFGYHLDMHLRF
jgi:hypothetical protein